jgi:hypothetical protein
VAATPIRTGKAPIVFYLTPKANHVILNAQETLARHPLRAPGDVFCPRSACLKKSPSCFASLHPSAAVVDRKAEKLWRLNALRGGLAEWFMAAVLKTEEASRPPWVRIPRPPPSAL